MFMKTSYFLHFCVILAAVTFSPRFLRAENVSEHADSSPVFLEDTVKDPDTKNTGVVALGSKCSFAPKKKDSKKNDKDNSQQAEGTSGSAGASSEASSTTANAEMAPCPYEGAKKGGVSAKCEIPGVNFEAMNAKLGPGFEGYFQRVANIESGCNAMLGHPSDSRGGSSGDRSNPNKGWGQMIPGTDMNGDPYDPANMADAMMEEALRHKAELTRMLGREPTQAELYLAHQQGVKAAAALINNPSTAAWQVVGPFYSRKSDGYVQHIISGNGGDPFAPASSFTALYYSKFGETAGGGSVPASVADTGGYTMPSPATIAGTGFSGGSSYTGYYQQQPMAAYGNGFAAPYGGVNQLAGDSIGFYASGSQKPAVPDLSGTSVDTAKEQQVQDRFREFLVKAPNAHAMDLWACASMSADTKAEQDAQTECVDNAKARPSSDVVSGL